MENNIKITNETIRRSLDSIERRLDKNSIKFYEDFYKELSNDKNYILYLDIMYFDTYLSLNYKSKTSLITPEERNIYKKLEITLLEEYVPYITFNNEKNIRNAVILESSKFRKYNSLIRSKIYYTLDSIDKGILSKVKHIVINEKYDLNIHDIEDFIKDNPNLSDLAIEIKNYLEFLYFKNRNRYKEIVFNIRKAINIYDLNSEEELSKIEIIDFINKVLSKDDKIKIYDITKK